MSYCLGKMAKEAYLASTLYDAIEDHDIRAISFSLTEKHANPNFILPNGIAPIHLALGNDDPDFALQVTKLIIQYGGNPNLRTDDGLTPLHIAAAWGHLELTELLVGCGADPEVRDYCNAMPIDYAIENKNLEIAQFLHYIAYCGPSFAELENRPAFNLILDKIVINNGVTEAQYEVEKSKKLLDLEQLPQASPIELVENWCSKHATVVSDNVPEKSIDSSLPFLPNTEFINCNPRNYKKPEISECSSLEFECSPKFMSKRSQLRNRTNIDIPLSNIQYTFAEASQESGIAILSDVSSDVCEVIEIHRLNKRLPDTSSDYFTCNNISGSSNIEEEMKESFIDPCLNKALSMQNISDNLTASINIINNSNAFFEEDLVKCTDSCDKYSRLSIAEVYKYSDEQEGIVLFEKRLLVDQKTTSDDSYQSQSSKLTSLPASFNYDTDTLRKELVEHGFHPGPITKTTKRLYLRKLFRIKKTGVNILAQPLVLKPKVYSQELQKTLNNPNWIQNLSSYRSLEDIVAKEFSNPDLTRRWREGINKSSFTYLLLDPRVTNNLPLRQDSLTLEETWSTFLSSIFYVGKGKRSRPYAHLYEAVLHWSNKKNISANKKLEHIINIWKDDAGVVCLHIFQNVIPCEAYTREAAIIKALGLENIDNKKLGDFYGAACTWSSTQQKMLGVILLHKAMSIFLNEGERQLKPTDIN